MIYIFRLSRLTGTNALFTIGREIHFDKLIYRGYSVDNYNPANTASYHFDKEFPVPIYADCSFLNENNIILNNGNLTTDDESQCFIPLGAVEGTTQILEDMCLSSKPEVWEADKQVRIRIREIEVDGGVIDSPLSAIFGDTLQEESTTNYAHAGINLIFEFTETMAHNHLIGTVAIADST